MESWSAHQLTEYFTMVNAAEDEQSAIAGAVERAVTDRDLADELRRRGVERARRFTWERTARATLSILAEAAGRSQTQGAAAA